MMDLSLGSVSSDVWLASAYCVLLVGLGHIIDALARRAASVAEGGASFGFSYHADHDAWQCPQDQWLWPKSFDPDNRVMRYRGTPSVCNACPVKHTCTTSSSGREIQRAVDSWPASEAARFHRGIACFVVVMGLVWPAAVAATGPGATGLLVLAAAVVVALLLSLPLWSHLHRTHVFLPEGMAHVTLDASLLEREQHAAAWHARRSSYGSDKRAGRKVSP
ncbi:hypothetical protein [Nocardioides sp.]|uniref:hypothetical protein n=1 Tax=Nocardioides sp. TaxID=35761 RepID=UPI0026396F0E|nr:hypothetical protein [Nocardioides sp.]MDI6912073.1 hypothetical protein [Nocardioides sp.]